MTLVLWPLPVDDFAPSVGLNELLGHSDLIFSVMLGFEIIQSCLLCEFSLVVIHVHEDSELSSGQLASEHPCEHLFFVSGLIFLSLKDPFKLLIVLLLLEVITLELVDWRLSKSFLVQELFKRWRIDQIS